MQQPLPLLLSPSFFYDQHRQRGGVDHWTVDNPPQHQIVFNFLALYLWACCSTDVLSDGLPSVLSVRAGNSFREWDRWEKQIENDKNVSLQHRIINNKVALPRRIEESSSRRKGMVSSRLADCVGVGLLRNFCFRNFAKFLISCLAKFSSNFAKLKIILPKFLETQNFFKIILIFAKF